ncbi:hypothetical protein Achl_1156 [Pseudarthrobacter chlorophenolicus A6]|uniref:Uncharacterized protein n=1 Tax=Pseudarthrobacter chlorophenolicus (strain ATCC 700700 / DSM 12829 / CIP 107037 / JCM 12360 / KCTC 9906 / NCIMB 13794 / A6) TaxID=452863 RepID=B8HEB2_PSECP|nr:hypothetical protein [Pseudarthrobacter chlorophenolicus]ACL39147.1 hypothetical protein Achl_1156 [Pseudarthrobacter chlorophenolicus A6]SDR03634.1 hypothetical protein SAMN04489738_4371 [Pseudarthrobacter chlorophenolicus]
MDAQPGTTSEALFSGLSLADPPAAPASPEAMPEAGLNSPFPARFISEAFAPGAGEAATFFAELEDEDFVDSLEQLINDAAAHQLADQRNWSSLPAEADSRASLEDWIEPVATEAERALDGFAERLAGADLYGMPAQEFEQLLEAAGNQAPHGLSGYEDFLGGLLRAGKKLVGGAVSLVKKGIAAVGKVLPVNLLLGKLKGLVRPLLRRVISAAMNRLPASVRPLARKLAAKLGVSEAEAEDHASAEGLAEVFGLEVASLLYAPEAEEELGENFFEPTPYESTDSLAALETARARFTERLAALPDGSTPAAEIEQFLPAVMAVQPLIKLGISIIGRQRVVKFVADILANLAKGLIGEGPAKLLATPVADLGLKVFGFETEADSDRMRAAEAVASTVEGTALRLMELPEATFEDQLQLASAVQEAFVEAAAAYLPDRVLHQELPERETAGEGGVWILMPRTAKPRYRFRKYTRVFAVPITRQAARAIRWSDGGTLEGHLLDRGVRRWPLEAEVDLYEAIPGTQFGHFTQDESTDEALEADSSEFQLLTPEIAGLLLREPALGRPGAGRGLPGPAGPGAHAPGAGVMASSGLGAAGLGRPRPQVGRRYFRIRSTALNRINRARRLARRLHVVMEPSKRRLRVQLRLSERQAQQVLALLQPSSPSARRDLPSVLAALRGLYEARLPLILASRLVRHQLAKDAAEASAPVDALLKALAASFSKFLSQRSAQLAAAVAEPAHGVTITATFHDVTRDKLGGAVQPPDVSVHAGWKSSAL